MRDDGERVRAIRFPELAIGVERNGPSQWYHRSARTLFVAIVIILCALFVIAVAVSVPEETPDDGASALRHAIAAETDRRGAS